jgi:hypothetical protein
MMVWLYLVYRQKLDGDKTLVLGNQALADWGVSRESKRQELADLEAAGLIKVARRPRRSALVTILGET